MIEWKETNGDFTAVCSYDTLTESTQLKSHIQTAGKIVQLGFGWVMNPDSEWTIRTPKDQSVNLRRFVLEWRTKNESR